ncbi:MAG: hypothetical protein COZ21_09060 [Bacteroidetes bacterium CG_4_10_14_3_um_filter_31_20]|nr:MAG: hypothetical protein COZ21_09060 [Bacteroidetes bacterium CG_4_10_14_3_um_filter_31_20]
MITTSKNYDIICFQMSNQLSNLETPLKKETTKLLAEIRIILYDGKKIKQGLNAILPIIFNYRFKAIKWLFENGKLDLSNIINDIYPQLEELKVKPKLEILVENILFALRCNKRVVDSVVSVSGNNEDKPRKNITEFSVINYEQFITSIALGIPDDVVAQKIVDLTKYSLYIEFVSVATNMIYSENLKVSDKLINELAFIVADAAQEYSAIAIELGVLKPRTYNKFSFAGHIDKSFVKENKYIAELGITDFAEVFK